LNPPDDLSEVTGWSSFPLQGEMIETKRNALEAHKTQFGYSARALSSFLRENELFGAIPPVFVARNTVAAMGGDTASLPTTAPDELVLSERERFVAVAVKSIRRELSNLELELEVSRWHPDIGISLFVFPHGSGRSFPRMPKLHLRLKAESHAMLDQERRLPAESTQITRSGNTMTVRVPMALLEGADKLLCSARTQIGEVPLDSTPWRVIELGQ
jgi:hypothetical protein